ncbi:hypothetical protein FHEFKHOI_01713 [Candidatus Methanoperedenaceae archaeon GB50]|nr:MAG: hypothetical protein KBONHNOK_00261 [Candidatus Methanoperedenaceae archaeon GB50]CAD7775151.1 hypothetical protein FHEFKHOI_01713 [Candidatus Methanoperedenaceae archaeon GB50]
MGDDQTDLKGNILVSQDELYFVYEGPSFNGKMEMPSLINQLKSTEFLIREVIRTLYEQIKLSEPENIKLYLKLKHSSFTEIIEIILNHPLSISIIGNCVVALFNKLFNKKGKEAKTEINIENLTNNLTFVKKIDNIALPLQKEGDKLTVYSPKKKEIKTEIKFKEKEMIKEILKKLQEEVTVEIYEEEFFGYLYMMNIDRGTLGFTLEGTNKHVPVTFISQPDLDELKSIFAEKLWIKANATYRNKELEKLEIKEYRVKTRKSLNDFFKKGEDKNA